MDFERRMYCCPIKAELDNAEVYDNPTNGESIKSMFPNAEYTVGKVGRGKVVAYLDEGVKIECSEEWWYSPYRKE